MSKAKGPFVPLNAGVITVSDTRTEENDTSGDFVQQSFERAGHQVIKRKIIRDDREGLQKLVKQWRDDPQLDVIVTTGGTGLTQRDITPEAIEPLYTKAIPGFGELFRMLSYDDIGTSTIESRATAGVMDRCLVFCLPGSTGACRLGMEKIILPQLDATVGPCNLVALLPRIRHEQG
jgi:molybdenum cofactor biosynthesis protein B